MATKIYLRRGTNAELQAIVLESGEPGWTTNGKKLYIGDGVTAGGNLIGGSGIGVDSLNGLIDVITISGAGVVQVTEDGQTIVVSGEDIIDVDSLNGLTGAITISGLGGVEVIVSGQLIIISGVDEFIELTDTPSSYAGESGKYVRVKAAEDGLEFATVSGAGVSEFTSLIDTPNEYTGHGHKLVTVNDAEDSLEFVKVMTAHNILADHDYSGIVTSGIAGEILVFGEHTILDSSAKWVRSIATVEEQTDGHIGIVIASGVLDDPIMLLLLGYIRDDSWSYITGSAIYIGTTSGLLTLDIPSVSGQFVRIVGHAKGTNVLWYNPDNTFIELG